MESSRKPFEEDTRRLLCEVSVPGNMQQTRWGEGNQDGMSKFLLDLQCPNLWPAALLAYLHSHHDVFLRWEARQGQIPAQVYDKAIYGLRGALLPYEILGWHCTRLTEAEADEILCTGMQLPNVEMLEHRIDALVRDGLVAPCIARRLKSENQAGESYRAGKVWFCFFPPRNAGEDGINRFFRHWGGEALYVCHECDPLTSPAISSIGTPCIIEADVPISLLQKHGNLEKSIYCRYLIGRGYQTTESMDYEDYIVHPIPAENVKRVISFPDPDFCSLTGCSEWRSPISHWHKA